MEENAITAEQGTQGEQGASNVEDSIKALSERIQSFEEKITSLQGELEKEKNSNIRLTRDNDVLRKALNGPRNTSEPEKSLFDDIM